MFQSGVTVIQNGVEVWGTVSLHPRACRCRGCAPWEAGRSTGDCIPVQSLIISRHDWEQAGRPSNLEEYSEFLRTPTKF